MKIVISPPLATCTFLLVATIASAIAIYVTPHFREIVRQHRGILLALIVTATLLRHPFCAPFYHGMEYEDCFVHQAVARQLLDPRSPINHESTYRQCISSFGSLLDSGEHQSFYHLIGYPTAIRIVQVVLGDTPSAAHWVSLLASLLNVLLVFYLAAQCDFGRTSVAAATIYVCLPLSIAFSATTSAEVFSSTWVTISLVLLGICVTPRPGTCPPALAYLGLSTSLVAAVLIKRENLLLVALLPILFLLADSSRESSIWARSRRAAWRAARALWLVILFGLVFVDLFASVRDEGNLVGPNAFSFTNLVALGPMFASALAYPRFYFVFGLLVVMLPLVWWRSTGTRHVIVCFLAYFLMYATHWRSYYFLQSHVVSPWDTLRYMLNLLPLLSIVAASGLMIMVRGFPERWRHPLHWPAVPILFVFSIVVASSVTGLLLRVKLTQAEQEERVKPMTQVIDFIQTEAPSTAWLLTFEPCLAQAYGPRWLQIIDLAMIDRFDKAELERRFQSGDVYAFLRPWDTDSVNRERMSAQLEVLQLHHWSLVAESPAGRLVKRAGPAS